MKSYVTRISFPRTFETLHGLFAHHGQGTDLESLIRGEGGAWSLHHSVLGNDIVFFQYTLSSRPNFKALLHAAEQAVDHVALSYLHGARSLVGRCAGRVVAVARIAGSAELIDTADYVHFKQRFFAPIEQVHFFAQPVRVVKPSPLADNPEFCSGGNLANRAFVSDENLQQLLATLVDAGNRLPEIIDGIHITAVADGRSIHMGNWIDYVRNGDAAFFLEAHLRLNFSNYLLKHIADNGRIYEEVEVMQKNGPVGRVDNVIALRGVLVPVEIKLNIATEANFLAQIAKYTQPIDLRKGMRRIGAVGHDVMLAVDQSGIYILKAARFHRCAANTPFLHREDLSEEQLTKLVDAVTALLPRPVDSSLSPSRSP